MERENWGSIAKVYPKNFPLFQTIWLKPEPTQQIESVYKKNNLLRKGEEGAKCDEKPFYKFGRSFYLSDVAPICRKNLFNLQHSNK